MMLQLSVIFLYFSISHITVCLLLGFRSKEADFFGSNQSSVLRASSRLFVWRASASQRAYDTNVYAISREHRPWEATPLVVFFFFKVLGWFQMYFLRWYLARLFLQNGLVDRCCFWVSPFLTSLSLRCEAVLHEVYSLGDSFAKAVKSHFALAKVCQASNRRISKGWFCWF